MVIRGRDRRAATEGVYLRFPLYPCSWRTYRSAFPGGDAACSTGKFYLLIRGERMSNLPMDPAFASLAKQPREVLRDANVVRKAVTAARQGTRPWQSDLDLEIEDHYVPFSDEEKTQIPVRIYRRRNAAGTVSVLLFLHGGGSFCVFLFFSHF